MATVDVSYVPGPLTAVAGDQCWALVEISPDSPAVSRIWQQLGQGAAADALLGGLIANGLGDTAGFTLLVAGTGGQHRLFCRGTVGATVVRAAADGGASPGEGQAAIERIDGAGLLTWREQVIDGADRIFLGEPPADTALRLPATSGVLLAGSVIIDLTNAAARDTVSYEEKPKKKTIVFFPDTITMTHPGSLADRAPGAPGSGAFAAPAPPTVGGPGAPFGGPVPAGVPGAASGPGNADGRAGDDAEYRVPLGRARQDRGRWPDQARRAGRPGFLRSLPAGRRPRDRGIRGHGRPVARPVPGNTAARRAALAASVRRGMARRPASGRADDRTGAAARADARADARASGRIRPAACLPTGCHLARRAA